jgi:hypothetical protein
MWTLLTCRYDYKLEWGDETAAGADPGAVSSIKLKNHQKTDPFEVGAVSPYLAGIVIAIN